MPKLETEILHYIFETTGIIIASSYFMISVIIIQDILQRKQRRGGQSKLATMMAVIFISCGLSHIIHVAAFHTSQ
jgi:hypothetical protein